MAPRDESPRREAAELAGELGTVLGTIVNLATVVSNDLPQGNHDAARDLDELVTVARRGSELTNQLADLAGSVSEPLNAVAAAPDPALG